MTEDEIMDETQSDPGSDALIDGDETVQVVSPDSDSQPDPGTDVPLDGGTVHEIPSGDEAQSDSDSDVPPMVVIPVEDLTDLLDEYFKQDGSDPEGSDGSEDVLPDEQGEAAESVEPTEDLPPAVVVSPSVTVDVDLAETEDQLSALTEILDHPALTTSFSDYTVTEALLLFLFLVMFLSACARMLKGVFSWLRS